MMYEVLFIVVRVEYIDWDELGGSIVYICGIVLW